VPDVTGGCCGPGGGPGGKEEALVFLEAWKARTDASVTPDPARIAEGWEFRFLADGPRAAEMEALYTELGFDVLLDPVAPERMAEGCKGCAVAAALRFTMLYTRRHRVS
jgi:hypothetical protein